MGTRPITDTLRLLDEGAFIDRCSNMLARLVRSVEETGKGGKLQITLQLKRGAKGALLISPEVTTKVPEPKLEPTMLYATVEGNLTTENPKQQKLDLRQVDPETGELRSLGSAPAPAASLRTAG
jgi:hypothetical protein